MCHIIRTVPGNNYILYNDFIWGFKAFVLTDKLYPFYSSAWKKFTLNPYFVVKNDDGLIVEDQLCGAVKQEIIFEIEVAKPNETYELIRLIRGIYGSMFVAPVTEYSIAILSGDAGEEKNIIVLFVYFSHNDIAFFDGKQISTTRLFIPFSLDQDFKKLVLNSIPNEKLQKIEANHLRLKN